MSLRIGNRGQTDTPLRPTGYVLIGNERHSARCQSGWLDAGAKVVVVSSDAYGLIVREAAGESERAGELIPTAAQRIIARDDAERKVRNETMSPVASLIENLPDVWPYWSVPLLLTLGVGWWLGEWTGVVVAVAVIAVGPLLIFLWHIARSIGSGD